MDELTLKIDCWINKEIKDYLLSINGIFEVNINSIENEINIKYNHNLINIKVLINEILLFLDILKTPSIISFDKHSKQKTEKYSIIIKNLCCEYCLKNMINDLLVIDGIETANSNFDYHNKTNVIISINYNSKLINKEKIKQIESKFNS